MIGALRKNKMRQRQQVVWVLFYIRWQRKSLKTAFTFLRPEDDKGAARSCVREEWLLAEGSRRVHSTERTSICSWARRPGPGKWGPVVHSKEFEFVLSGFWRNRAVLSRGVTWSSFLWGEEYPWGGKGRKLPLILEGDNDGSDQSGGRQWRWWEELGFEIYFEDGANRI